MIPLLSSYLAKSKQRWWEQQEVKLREEFAPKLLVLQDEIVEKQQAMQQQITLLTEKQQQLESHKRDVDDWEQRVTDRRQELAHVNEELKDQIRLIEAKATPDSVWVEAFSRGYEKAWDTMWPLMTSGLQKSHAAIYQQAVDQTLANLDTTILQRAESLGQVQVRETQELLAKQADFTRKRAVAKSPTDQAKYDHYLEALEWILDGHRLLPNQPLPR